MTTLEASDEVALGSGGALDCEGSPAFQTYYPGADRLRGGGKFGVSELWGSPSAVSLTGPPMR